MKAVDLTKIAFLLTLGIVLKLTTDVFNRTILLFLMIDPLMLITVLILMRYPKFKIALNVAIIEMFFSLMFFTATDIWFVRPFIVFIAFLVVKIFYRKGVSLNRIRYALACSTTSFLTLTFVSLIFILVLFIAPSFLPLEQMENQMNAFSNFGLMDENQKLFLENNFKSLVAISLLIMGTLFAIIPATTNGIIAYGIARVFRLNKN